MVCTRCGQMYAEVVPVYCVCGAPLNQGAGHWESTVALPNQFAGHSLAPPDDDMHTTFVTPSSAHSTMIWAARTAPGGPPAPPPPLVNTSAATARSRTTMLIGIACVLFAMAGVALFGAVALAQHPPTAAAVPHNTKPLAATPQHKSTATPTPKPNPLALSNWHQNATCVVRDNAMSVSGTGSHQSGYLCDAPVGIVSNVTVTSQATFGHGGSSAAIGIAVRVNRTGKTLVSADEVYLNESGLLVVMQRWQGQTLTLLPAQTVPGAATGTGATNTLTVTTQGNLISISVNGQQVTSVEDHDTPPTGGIALAVWKYGQTGTFTNTALTTNP